MNGPEREGPEVPPALVESFRAMQDGPRIAERLRAAESFGRGVRSFQDELARRAVDEGLSYAAIGRALGITREAARQRYGSPSS